MVRRAKIFWSIICLAILASHLWSISHWNEQRGVYDDVCYLRQAHLFQRFGLDGFNTDVVRDDDRWMVNKLKQIDYSRPEDPAAAPCHYVMPKTGKRVIQYPPGTGFLLSLFPEGFQVIPLYSLATIAIAAFALSALWLAPTLLAVLIAGMFGATAVYFMINPVKASYSVGPTMVICALVGLLTAQFIYAGRRTPRLVLAAGIGLLIGLAANLRLANFFLSGGYAVLFLVTFLRTRSVQSLVEGALFGLSFVIGLTPTLVANAINAGSPFSTTYVGDDAALPKTDVIFSQLALYLSDTQGNVLLTAAVLTVACLLVPSLSGVRKVAYIVAGNIVVNLAFFLTHPVAAPYYLMPIGMLCLWTLLFGYVLQPEQAGLHAAGTRSAPAGKAI